MLLKKKDAVTIPVGNASPAFSSDDIELDIALLEHNLSLSYEERLEEHQSALNLVLELQLAGQWLRAGQNETRSK